jgi:hypothetical protein
MYLLPLLTWLLVTGQCLLVVGTDVAGANASATPVLHLVSLFDEDEYDKVSWHLSVGTAALDRRVRSVIRECRSCVLPSALAAQAGADRKSFPARAGGAAGGARRTE